MMRQLARSVLLLCMAQTASAQAIVVRSGEHETFSRLVLDVPPGVTWSLTQNGRSAALALGMDAVFVDISNVFTRIPKTRLQNLSSNNQTLLIKLGCDCPVIVELLDDQMLVVDITDPVDVSTARDEPMPSPNRDPAITVPSSDAKRIRSRFGFGELLWSLQRGLGKPHVLNESSNGHNRPETALTLTVHSVEEDTIVRAAQKRLLAEIGKAATMGLLDPNVAPKTPTDGEAVPAKGADSPDARTALTSLTDTKENLRVHSSAVSPDENNLGKYVSTKGNVCPDPDLFSVHDWGTSQSFSAQIGQWRQILMGEFDRLDQNAVVSLARNYTYFGFGAEAQKSAGARRRSVAAKRVSDNIGRHY